MDILRGKACMLVACVLAMAFVIEAEPPTFTSCRNYITPAAGELPQAVNFPLPEAQDPGGNLVQVSCSHRPGDKFPLGKTQVTCNATVGSETSTCKFKVGVGDGVNCTRDLNECVCRGETCTCFKGFTGIDCAIEDGTVCTGPSTPSDGCGNTCPAVSCRCERGWEGPSCNFVDDGSSCFSGVGSPPHCEECFIGDSPPCICEKGWQGIRCENDYLPPVFVSCPPDIFMKAGSGEDRAVVTWDDPRAVDNSGAEPNIVCDRTSGSWFSGTSLVTCTASDGTGNSVSDCIFNVTVTDEKAPVMTCPASGSWNVDSGADVATVIWSPLPEATDNIDGKLQVTCTDALGNVVNSGDEFLVGETSVFCLASDKSGNQGRCGFSITVVDNEGPIVTCPSSVTQNVETGKADAAVKWSPLPSAEDAVEGPVPTVVCTDEGGKAAESGNRFPAGNTMVTCSAMDSVGNKGNCSFLIIILDNEAPIMTCPDDIVRNVDAGKAVATVDWPIMPQANDTVDGLLAVTCSDGSGGLVSSGDEFPVDVTMVTCTASDTSHNEGTCSFLITVIDNEDPFIACPENIFQDLDAGSDVGTVHWPTQPSANDTVDGSLAVTCTDDSGIVVKSGDTFSVGATIVTCKAIDGSGNEANCSFTINLKDVEGPVVTCPKDSRQNVEPGRASAAVDWSPSPSAEDVVDGLVPNLTCKAEDGKLVESGGRFPVGKTKITCLAVDSARNEGNCSFVITVVDNESPVFTCLISNITENVSPGLAIGIIHWPSVPFANDTVDGPVAVSCFDSLGKLVSSGDPFAVGVTVVTCKASDSSGNEASCRFTITVIDNEGPVMTCPRNVSQDLDPGSSAGVVVWPTLPLASDTVDGFLTVTCENDSGDPVSSGDEFPVGVTVVTCEATDDSGNKGRCDFAITVKACEPCQNGGHSQDPDTCACQCPEVYAGLLCSECKECVNGGNQDKDTCVCDCFNSYMGVLCDVCPPDIKCDNAGQFEEAACRCNCPPPWTGPTCSECIPCAHGGTDQDPDTCLCDCPGAYLPPVCAACGGQAECQNGGEFSEVSCNCTCPSPFTGKTCTECEPCQNGGSYQNKFMCVCDCPYFHTDPLCAVCPLGFVCLNGGTRREATCSCECANGWRAKDCSERVPNVPDDEYPVSPIWTVVKKKVSFEIAVIAPIYNGTVCDPRISKFSDACIALVTEFKLSVEIEYKFVAGFSQVVINQEDLRAGSVVVPHEVIYNYEEMTPTTRGISANALYGETVGKAVVRGYIGKLKVATGCEDCMAPQDHTYICDAEPPECAPGLMLTERAEGGEGTCYYVCRSKCKLDTTYCGDGTCRQEQGSKDISCSCPQSSAVMYSGAKCQNQVQLTWLYVGVSVGVVSILVLIVVLSVCLWRSKGLVDRLQEEDEEKVVLGKPMSDELMKELNSYCNNNNGSTGETYFHKPPSGESTRPSLYAQISQEHKRNRAIKNGQAPGAGSGAKVGGLRAHLSPGSPKYEAQIKPNDFDGSRSPRGERRPWYFWGKMSLPKKRDIKMIPMTSETGRF
ncbi:hyalin-like isoform X4 [Acanthaster planci]|uniref:Hyalin-like isoform X4 n=1 Tax=Acanthaster planci TaxID=133434 RepID=A0A8B8A2P1_ACAPL|nr:hyalin-like isoform X4 [Acanthaster planci]